MATAKQKLSNDKGKSKEMDKKMPHRKVVDKMPYKDGKKPGKRM